MPELHWRYGYIFILGIVETVVAGMIFWFRHKGWFDVSSKTGNLFPLCSSYHN